MWRPFHACREHLPEACILPASKRTEERHAEHDFCAIFFVFQNAYMVASGCLLYTDVLKYIKVRYLELYLCYTTMYYCGVLMMAAGSED